MIYVVDSSDTDRIGVAKEEFHAILEVNYCYSFLFRCNWFITLLIDEGYTFTVVVALLGIQYQLCLETVLDAINVATQCS